MTSVHRYRRVELTGPGQLEIRDATLPDPGPGEVLLAPDAVGICGTDIELAAGHMAYLDSGFARYPITPGHEWTALVEAVGEGVEGVRVGDRVVGECAQGCGVCAFCRAGRYHVCPDRRETGIVRFDGAMGQRMLFPVRSLHVLTPDVDRRDAALIEPLAVSYRGVRRLFGDQPGATLVIGGGTIGVLSAMVARALGADDVVVVEPSEERSRWAREAGFETVTEASGRWPNVVEASGNAAAMKQAFDLLDLAGRLLFIGLCGELVEVNVDRMVLDDQLVLGSLSSPGVWPETIALVTSGRVRPGQLISHEFSLDEAPGAYARVRSRAPGTFKVVINPQR